MIKIDRYVSPTPEALARLKDDLGVTSQAMAELTGLAQGQQWRKYTGGITPRVMGMQMHFYMAALLTLSDTELAKVLATMRKQGAEVEYGEGPTVTVTEQRSRTMNIEMKVSLHPSGNRTLMERKKGHTWADVLQPEGVFANNDPVQFYRVTANYIAALSQDGYEVQYQDTTLD